MPKCPDPYGPVSKLSKQTMGLPGNYQASMIGAEPYTRRIGKQAMGPPWELLESVAKKQAMGLPCKLRTRIVKYTGVAES